jgi:hypothetical protein
MQVLVAVILRKEMNWQKTASMKNEQENIRMPQEENNCI